MKKSKKEHNFDEIVRLCRTCERASVVKLTGDYLCDKFGVVEHDSVCRKYKLNKSLPRPAKRRMVDTLKFNVEDFQV